MLLLHPTHTMLGPLFYLGSTPPLLGVPPSTRQAHMRALLAPLDAHNVTLREFSGCRAGRTSRVAAQQSVSGSSGRLAAGVGRRTAEQERAQLHKPAGCSAAAQNRARKAMHALATTSATTAAHTESDAAAQLALRPARRSSQAAPLDWLPGAWDGRPAPNARSGSGPSGARHGKARKPMRGNELVRHLGEALLALREGESPSQVLAGQRLDKRESTKCGPLTSSFLGQCVLPVLRAECEPYLARKLVLPASRLCKGCFPVW